VDNICSISQNNNNQSKYIFTKSSKNERKECKIITVEETILMCLHTSENFNPAQYLRASKLSSTK
jgi:hypothetical protein